MDYGTVLCVASNVVGRQIVPCIYHVIPAGRTNELKKILEWEFETAGTNNTMAEISISIEIKYFGSDCSILLEF